MAMAEITTNTFGPVAQVLDALENANQLTASALPYYWAEHGPRIQALLEQGAHRIAELHADLREAVLADAAQSRAANEAWMNAHV
jgi:hypothetical protein